jgi:hypothetical protein
MKNEKVIIGQRILTGKKYLDDKYGTPRGNGYGVAGILDEFGKLKIQEEIAPTLKIIKERASVEYVKVLLQELIDKYDRR